MRTIPLIPMVFLAALTASSALAQERSCLCQFTGGPRAGQVQDYTGHPSGPLPVGTPCQDGIASWGVIISGSNGGQGSGGSSSESDSSSCVRPRSESDCDACRSDRSYERCLEKVGSTHE